MRCGSAMDGKPTGPSPAARRGIFGGHDRRVAALFDSWAGMLHAGLAIGETLRTTVGRLPAGPFRSRLQSLEKIIEGGRTFSEALEETRLFTRFELVMIRAGEKSGRLPDALRRLARLLEERVRRRSAIIVRVLYPFLLIHLACLAWPLRGVLTAAFSQEEEFTLLDYMLDAGLALGVLWGLVLGATLAFKILRAIPGIRAITDRLILALPLVGSIVLKLVLAEVIHSLSMLYRAGIPIIEAVREATTLCPNRAISRHLEGVGRRLDQGSTVTAAFEDEGAFPPLVIRMLAIGEKAGSLDATFEKLEAQFDQENRTALSLLTWVASGLAFLCAAGMVVFVVLSFWLNYAKLLQQHTD